MLILINKSLNLLPCLLFLLMYFFFFKSPSFITYSYNCIFIYLLFAVSSQVHHHVRMSVIRRRGPKQIRTIMKKDFRKTWIFLQRMNAKVLYISELLGHLVGVKTEYCLHFLSVSWIYRLCFLLLQRWKRFRPPLRVCTAE